MGARENRNAAKAREKLPLHREEAEAKELLRERYRPARVRMLFVGEAPPASGRFFYRADSGLYRALRSAFVKAFPALRDVEFLPVFQALGCYLVDLCGRPVDRMEKGERQRICIESEPTLAQTIDQLRPEMTITVVRSIAANVRRVQQRANWRGQHLELPYPGRWLRHRVAFEKAIVPVLRRELAGVQPALTNGRRAIRQFSAQARKRLSRNRKPAA